MQEAPAIDQPSPPSMPMHSIPDSQDEPPVTQSANTNQTSSLDSEILAYIDQSLKTLIGTNQNNTNNIPNHLIQPTPFMPMVIYSRSSFFTSIFPKKLLFFKIHFVYSSRHHRHSRQCNFIMQRH